MKILIVDDEVLICENLKGKIERISKDTHQIEVAYSAQEGFILFEKSHPDIVITDIHMPGISGISLAKRIREIDKQVPILILSGYDDFSYVRKAFLVGVNDYLLKPVAAKELMEKISNVTKECKVDHTIQNKNINENNIQIDHVEENHMINHAIEYMLMNIDKALTMKDVAEYINMSYSYFGKVFKRHIGSSFNAYLLKIRMEKALQYIEDPYIKVNEIAYKVGYNNPSHFSRAFKQYTGKYPIQYRNETSGI